MRWESLHPAIHCWVGWATCGAPAGRFQTAMASCISSLQELGSASQDPSGVSRGDVCSIPVALESSGIFHGAIPLGTGGLRFDASHVVQAG